MFSTLPFLSSQLDAAGIYNTQDVTVAAAAANATSAASSEGADAAPARLVLNQEGQQVGYKDR